MSTSTELAPLPSLSAKAESVICSGDLKDLAPDERVLWYKIRCQQVGLDFTTEPFKYLFLNNKLVLYATKTATEQIASNRRINLQIIARETVMEAYVVTCRGSEPDGRFTESIGAVTIKGKAGDDFCNALMKAETKAKRRAVLSLTGLSMLDESEIETTGARPAVVDILTGEILSEAAPPPQPEPQQETPAVKAADLRNEFKDRAEKLGFSGNGKDLGEVGIELLHYRPDRWDATIYRAILDRPDNEFVAAIETVQQRAAVAHAPEPAEVASKPPLEVRRQHLEDAWHNHFGKQRLEEGLQKAEELLRRECLSYDLAFYQAAAEELDKLERWLTEARTQKAQAA